MAEGMTLEEQGEVGRAFLAGLLSEYGVTASVETRLLDDETVEIAALGEDLGLLVGPRGSTLMRPNRPVFGSVTTITSASPTATPS